MKSRIVDRRLGACASISQVIVEKIRGGMRVAEAEATLCSPLPVPIILPYRAFQAGEFVRTGKEPPSMAYTQLVGRSPALQQVRRLIGKIARCDENVLGAGESGRGKELVACALHTRRRRAAQPFVPIKCAALSE